MSKEAFGAALRCGEDVVYGQEAFRHLLAVERARAARARRSLLLLLVSLRPRTGARRPMPRAEAAALFSSLGVCLREVDLLGWFREGRVAAAVLVQGGAGAPDLTRQVTERVTQALGRELSANLAGRLRMRVVRLHETREVA